MNDVTLFAFEDDFVATLRCIPMAVRFKLDACGVKVTLRQWSRLTAEERRTLLLDPCDTPDDIEAYRRDLLARLQPQTDGTPQPLPPGSTVAWDDAAQTPSAVRQFAASRGVEPVPDTAWAALTPLQRFVLLKLSRDNHDNVNFVPALKEFGLYRARTSSLPVSAAASA